jgi:hypothetical protein
MVHPFRYREAARFWEITDPRLAALVHAVVGGTPAYRYEFTQGDVPTDLSDFDSWVTRTVLDPRTPLFREARYLLAEESEIRVFEVSRGCVVVWSRFVMFGWWRYVVGVGRCEWWRSGLGGVG